MNNMDSAVFNLEGITLGQYELIELIGEGGAAAVYKAFQLSLERWVALKVLLDITEDKLMRFEREAKTIARLQHRNVLKIYEYGNDGEYSFISMEFVARGTLEEYLSDEPLDWVEVLHLVIPIAGALYYAHQQGLVHRDIKPSNILMPEPDWPLLADFGLVRLQESKTISPPIRKRLLGTPQYMSPEQTHADDVDHRADVYAFGILLFRMLTGRLPFDYNNPYLIMLAHSAEPMPLPSDYNQPCPPELERIILKATAKDPDDRYQSMKALTHDLKDVLEVFSIPTHHDYAVSTRPSLHWRQNGKGKRVKNPAARFMLPDRNDTMVPIPRPPTEGLIMGRAHHKINVDIDLRSYGAVQAGLSRQHAKLTFAHNSWYIEDMDSVNGTLLNDYRLDPHQPIPLRNGDRVTCGLLTMIFLTA